MRSKIISIINKYINVVLFAITIFVALGISVYFLQEGNYLKLAGETYDILYLIFFVGIFILLKKMFHIFFGNIHIKKIHYFAHLIQILLLNIL